MEDRNFVKGNRLPGNEGEIICDLPVAPTIKRAQLYLGLQDFFPIPIYTNPNYKVTRKPNCPPLLINKDSLHKIGDQYWRETYMNQPAVKSLLWTCAEGPQISLVSQPISRIQNETDVNALYCYIESWAIGLLRLLQFPVTGSREVRREQDEELQPKAPADNDLRLRLDATMTWSHDLFINYSWVGAELKFYGMNADDNWHWDSPEVENLQGQLIQYAKTLGIFEMNCFDGYYWTLIQFSKDGYDKRAKVFRGTLYNGVLALVASFLATWIEKEFEMTRIPDARILAQGVLYSETGPLLVLMRQGNNPGWYISRTGLRVNELHQTWVRFII